jgi:hypothetical protein
MFQLICTICLLCLTGTPVSAQLNDESLQPAKITLNPTGSDYNFKRTFLGIPGMERAANGRLWALWYGGGKDEGPDNYVMLVTSDDDGATWSDLKVVIDNPDSDTRAYDPVLWHDPTGKLWVFWAQSYKFWDGRSGVWCMTTENSGDADPTWSQPRRLADGIMMNKPTVLSDGQWLLATSVWHADGSSRILSSNDKGATWHELGRVNVPVKKDRTFDESMLVERKNGDLWLLVRTTYGIGESVSHDRGKTWSDVVKSPLAQVSARFCIRRLNSGHLLLVKHGPLHELTPKRSHLTAYLSEDDGQTWTGGLLIDERVGVSYPDIVQDKAGAIYLIYDFDRYKSRNILMSKFTEENVRSGKPDDKTKFRVLVNQVDHRNEEKK